MPHPTKVICTAKNYKWFTIGKSYDLTDMELRTSLSNGSVKIKTVLLDDDGFYRTYSLYSDSFISIEKLRNNKLNSILKRIK